MFPNWAKNILFLLVYMISGLVLVIIIEGLVSGSDLTPLNTVVEKLVAHVRTPFFTTFLVFVTKAGNPFVLSSATALIAIILLMRRHYYDALLFATTMAIAIISLTVLKNVFQITRPVSDLITANGWSFPSGHATVATAFFFMIAHTFIGKFKTFRAKTYLVVGSIVGAALICFSRLYLGAHWTLDILAGVALGLLAVSFSVLVSGVFRTRRSLRRRNRS